MSTTSPSSARNFAHSCTLPQRGQAWTPADHANALLVHYKAFVCWLLDAAQPACPTGEYAPVRICADVATILRAHDHFNRVAVIDQQPDGTLWLWLKSNYDSDYAVWAARHNASIEARRERVEENARAGAFVAAYKLQQRALRSKASDDTLAFMAMEMIADYADIGEQSAFTHILRKLGYLS